jgi:hypothetical protein
MFSRNTSKAVSEAVCAELGYVWSTLFIKTEELKVASVSVNVFICVRILYLSEVSFYMFNVHFQKKPGKSVSVYCGENWRIFRDPTD